MTDPNQIEELTRLRARVRELESKVKGEESPQVKELRAQIGRIHSQAAPLRSRRELMHQALEKDKADIKDVSQQIFSIEEPLRRLNAELHLALKSSGRQVISLPTT